MDLLKDYIEQLREAVLEYNSEKTNNVLINIINFIETNKDNFNNNMDLVLSHMFLAMKNKDYWLLVDLTQYELLNNYKDIN